MHAKPVRAMAALCAMGILLLSALPAAAQSERKPPSAVARVIASQTTKYQGKDVVGLNLQPVTGGRPFQAYVEYDAKAPPGGMGRDAMNLKKGDIVKVELDNGRPLPAVKYLRAYSLRPGEEMPNNFVYENSFEKEDGNQKYLAVVLSKFDEMVTVAVPQKKEKEGGTVRDPEMVAFVDTLKKGDVVEAEVKTGGRVPVLSSLDLYKAPETGKFLKLAEEEVNGQKGMAVEVEREGKPVKLLVSGKMQGTKWVNDPKVMAAARKLKADALVQFTVREEGERLWLKNIQAAPRVAPASSSDKEMAREGGSGEMANDKPREKPRDRRGK